MYILEWPTVVGGLATSLTSQRFRISHWTLFHKISQHDLQFSAISTRILTRGAGLIMVSADNLPYDVLSLIFRFLSASPNDLACLSLVSKSFLSAALPFIYGNITIHSTLVANLNHVRLQTYTQSSLHFH